MTTCPIARQSCVESKTYQAGEPFLACDQAGGFLERLTCETKVHCRDDERPAEFGLSDDTAVA